MRVGTHRGALKITVAASDLRGMRRSAAVAGIIAAACLAVPATGLSAGCGVIPDGVQCGPGNGRTTAGGGEKVSHRGWPAVTGVLWKVLDSSNRIKAGGPDNDELLGHHGSDRLTGGPGRDILWGDWDPRDNTTRQRDVLLGGAGADYIYPSHGTTIVNAGPGNDYVWAFYGRGTIDCGPGHDIVHVRMNGAFKLRGCEVVKHFCSFGSDVHGNCLKPGEKQRSSRRTG